MLKPGTAKIAYGQHITDGDVRYAIGDRKFMINFELTKGEHEFEQYFIRISGRYIQAFLPKGIEIVSVGIIPYIYPLTVKDFRLKNSLDQNIYDVCIHTLEALHESAL